MNRILPDVYAPFSVPRKPGRQPRRAPDFLGDMHQSLRRAGLGRFFGVTPKTTAGRVETFSRPGLAVKNQRAADEKQVRDIYQAMLDITGH